MSVDVVLCEREEGMGEGEGEGGKRKEVVGER